MEYFFQKSHLGVIFGFGCVYICCMMLDKWTWVQGEEGNSMKSHGLIYLTIVPFKVKQHTIKHCRTFPLKSPVFTYAEFKSDHGHSNIILELF